MNEAFKKFPRNKYDFEGAIVLYSTVNETFYRFAFGSGDNLSQEDVEEGFDDYMMYDAYKFPQNPIFTKEEMFAIVKYEGGYIDNIKYLTEVDGGMMLIKRKDYNDSGDIRDYLENALDFVYGLPKGTRPEEFYKDLELVYFEN